MDEMETKTTPAPAAPPPQPKVELRNSLWCVHTVNGRVGMINEIHSGIATFHYASRDGELEESVQVPQEELRIAKAAELPGHLGFTEQQCEDIGYL
jgi:hypothetical protein